jgi:hypothetical protein
MQETLQNFGINLVATLVLGFLFVRDMRARARDEETVKREEALSRLQVCAPSH